MKRLVFLLLFILFYLTENGNGSIGYRLSLSLNPEKALLLGRELVLFRNTTGDTLRFIYFHLNPNGFRDRNSETYQRYENLLSEPCWINIKKIQIDGKECLRKGEEEISMQVFLPAPLAPGDSVTLEIEFETKIPRGKHFFCSSRQNSTFLLFCFYPFVEYYYEKGWLPDRYQGVADPFGDFANYQVEISIPAAFNIAGSTHISKVEYSGDIKKVQFARERLLDFGLAISREMSVLKLDIDSIQIELITNPDQFKNQEFRLRRLKGVLTDIVNYYSRSFGMFPTNHLTLVRGFVRGGYATSSYIVLDRKIFDRLCQLDPIHVETFAHELAHQYFGFLINANESYETWLNEGFADYAARQYMQERFPLLAGRYEISLMERARSLVSDMGRIFSLSLENFSLLQPVYTPGRETDFNSPVDLSKYVKGRKVVEMISLRLGKERFREYMRSYVQHYSNKTITTGEFFRYLTEYSGEDWRPFRRRWLERSGVSDLFIKKIKSEKVAPNSFRHQIIVGEKDESYLPVEVAAITRAGDTIRTVSFSTTRRDTIQIFTRTPLKSVIIDPDRKLWEFNRLNNYYPPRVRIWLPNSLPSIESYQIYPLPTVDFNRRDRLRLGLRLKGSYWIHLRPVFPAESMNDWSLGINYGFGSKTWGYEAGYATTIKRIKRNPRLNILIQNYFGIERRTLNMDLYLGKINYPIINRVVGFKRLSLRLRYIRSYNLEFVNSDRWERGVVLYPEINLINFHNWGNFRHVLQFTLRRGFELAGADFEFFQLYGDIQLRYNYAGRHWYYFRIFAGGGSGNIPRQNLLYFFGKNILENSSFASFRQVSSMGNMRGYGQHALKSKNMITSNNEVHFNLTKSKIMLFDLLLFYDLGLVGKWDYPQLRDKIKTDAGLGIEYNFGEYLKAGFHFPLFVSSPMAGEKRWKFRWLFSYRINF